MAQGVIQDPVAAKKLLQMKKKPQLRPDGSERARDKKIIVAREKRMRKMKGGDSSDDD